MIGRYAVAFFCFSLLSGAVASGSDIDQKIVIARKHGGKVSTTKSRVFRLRFFYAIDFTGVRVKDDVIAQILPDRSVRRALLSLTEAGDNTAKLLGECPQLERVILRGTNVTDAGAAHLGSLTKLKWLSLADTAVTDRAVESLAKIKSLTYLRLVGTRITEKGIGKLHKSLPDTHIEWRTIESEKIRRAVISLLRHDVDVSHSNFSADEKPGRKLGRFRVNIGKKSALDKDEIDIVSSLDVIMRAKQTRVYISDLPDSAIKTIARCRALTDLEIEGPEVTDAGLKPLAASKSLTRVCLTGEQFTGAALWELAKVPNLKTLYLSCPEITDKAITIFKKKRPKVTIANDP